MVIQVRRLRDTAILPTRGSSMAAGYDLYACVDAPVTVPAGETRKIGTGIAAAIPEGYFGACFARSGLAAKCGLRPANCVGVVDSDYRGEFFVALYNDSPVEQIVQNGDRIAQLVILPFMAAEFTETDVLPETERGAGGFGSTGK